MPTTTHLAVAELADGVRLPYAEHGHVSGVPVVLLHGITDSWRSFDWVLPHLPASVHAFAVTQRGHGEASRPGSYRLDDLVGDVASFMDALGLPEAVICGHSMGSIVATRFALTHPRRTAGLVVMGGATAFAGLGLEAFTAELDALEADGYEEYLRAFQESTLAQPTPREVVDVAVAESLKVSIPTFRALWHGTVLTDFAGELGDVRAPTLVVWGERDAFCPRAEQDALVGAIPGARLSVYAGAGHAMHWEEPERFADELAAFATAVAA